MTTETERATRTFKAWTSQVEKIENAKTTSAITNSMNAFWTKYGLSTLSFGYSGMLLTEAKDAAKEYSLDNVKDLFIEEDTHNPAVYLFIRVRKQDYGWEADYRHVDAEFVHFEKDNRKDNNPYLINEHGLRYFSDSSWEQPRMGRATDLRVVSSMNKDMLESKVYAQGIEYKPFTVDLQDAEAMVKTLGRIDRYLTKTQPQYGDPAESFGRYVRRIADAVGAVGAVIVDESQKPVKNGYFTYTAYERISLDDMVDHINQLTGKCLAELGWTPDMDEEKEVVES